MLVDRPRPDQFLLYESAVAVFADEQPGRIAAARQGTPTRTAIPLVASPDVAGDRVLFHTSKDNSGRSETVSAK